MTEHGLWRFSRACQDAINLGDLAGLDTLLDDDVEWALYGPIDMFPFLGARRGKPAVLDVFRQIAKKVEIRRFDRESVMLGDGQGASMVRYSLTTRGASRPISIRLAYFAQFRRERLTSLRAVVDTFDMIEQALGRPIHLPQAV